MTFTDFNLTTPLLNALTEHGYVKPTTIQAKAFSVVMSGKDVCGIAQTGTGKTFAYLLPVLRQWKYGKDRYPQIMILVPTRELVVQVVEAVKELTTYMTVEVVGAYGGVNMKTQAVALENGCDIVVATPGRLLDLAYNGALKVKNIRKLIIDEMDEMLSLGFRTQLNNILDLLPPKRQNLLFSATITEDVEKVMDTYFNAPIIIEAAPTGTPLDNISQFGYSLPNFYTKINMLKLLLTEDKDMTKVLVFVASKRMADDVYEQLEPKFNEEMGVIHSNKDQNFRFNTVNQFQSGTYRFIIATDIIARGLDISEVTHVINFDTPDIPEDYMHRIGRTGRADKKGISITFTNEKEEPYKAAIEELMNYKIPTLSLPDHLEISTELTYEEQPKGNLKEIFVKIPKRENVGAAFHERSAKRMKDPTKIKHSDKMKLKYKKPIKRKPKK